MTLSGVVEQVPDRVRILPQCSRFAKARRVSLGAPKELGYANLGLPPHRISRHSHSRFRRPAVSMRSPPFLVAARIALRPGTPPTASNCSKGSIQDALRALAQYDRERAGWALERLGCLDHVSKGKRSEVKRLVVREKAHAGLCGFTLFLLPEAID
jgi:hypothetical protein